MSLSRAFRPLFPPNLNGTRTQKIRTMASWSSYCHDPRDTALPYSLVVLEYMASRSTLDDPGYALADQINSTPAAFRDSRAASRSTPVVSTESQLIWSMVIPSSRTGTVLWPRVFTKDRRDRNVQVQNLKGLYLLFVLINRERANLGCC